MGMSRKELPKKTCAFPRKIYPFLVALVAVRYHHGQTNPELEGTSTNHRNMCRARNKRSTKELDSLRTVDQLKMHGFSGATAKKNMMKELLDSGKGRIIQPP